MPRIRQNLEQLQGIRQRLQSFVRSSMHESDTEKRLAGELQQERERRRQAEDRLRQLQRGADAAAVAKQTYALPEPDLSINRRQIFLSLISPLKPGKMLDLAAGAGNFSLTAAQLGWEVTAVDIRTMRTPDAEAEEKPKRAELIRSVKWVQADVREFPVRSGEYDLICIFGFMHHLELDDQFKLLRRCSSTHTLLTVRVAPEILDTEGPYEGMYFREEGETREERDEIAKAAWGNEFAFLHTEESLLRLMRDCGYSKVMAMRPPHQPNFTFYLCLPSLPNKT
jgi:2-polyprenyl-3-methyl-5-hydroxy-6-metoxy-1,4-benzoquinol methylase